MLDKNGKKKLRHILGKRLGISFGLIVVVGFSSVMVLKQNKIVPQIQDEHIHIQTITKKEELDFDNYRSSKLAIHEEVNGKKQRVYEEYEAEGKLLFSTTTIKDDGINLLSLMSVVASLSIILGILMFLNQERVHISVFIFRQIVNVIPEECVAELEASSRQLHSSNKPRWLINLIVLRGFLESIFAFYIRIKVENFFY